jgi:hypothetical protein
MQAITVPRHVICDTIRSFGGVSAAEMPAFLRAVQEAWEEPGVAEAWKPSYVEDMDEWMKWKVNINGVRWHGYDNWREEQMSGPCAFSLKHTSMLRMSKGAPTYKVNVGGLWSAGVEDVLHAMAVHGPIAQLTRNREEGTACVEYMKEEDMHHAVAWSQRVSLGGNVLTITPCEPVRAMTVAAHVSAEPVPVPAAAPAEVPASAEAVALAEAWTAAVMEMIAEEVKVAWPTPGQQTAPARVPERKKEKSNKKPKKNKK